MKKKVAKKAVAAVSEPTELPIIDKREDDDVEEDHPVFDMSAVPTPVIAPFELPKPKSVEAKKAKNEKGANKNKSKEALTAEKLNNEITKLRKVVVIAKTRLINKLVRRKKELEGKVNKLDDKKMKEQFGRQANRIGEELDNIGGLDRDTVAKFAFLNQKSLNELIKADTIASERLMYKLACHELIEKEVRSLREKYTDFNKTAAFFMQRLGSQYADKKVEKEKGKKQKKPDTVAKKDEDVPEDVEEDEADNDVLVYPPIIFDPDAPASEGSEDDEEVNDDDDDDDDDDDGSGGESYDMSDVEMVNSDEEEEAEAVEKRRKLLLGLIGVGVDKSRPEIKPKKRKIEENEDEEVDKKEPNKKEAARNEMKKVLEKELKSAEAEKPKTLKKQTKKVSTTLAQKASDELPVMDESEPQTLIKRIKLSAGGKIEKSSAKSVEKKNEKTAIVHENEDDEEDEEESAFFLPKTENPGKRAVEAKSFKKSAKEHPKKAAVPVPVVDEKKKKGVSKKQNLTGQEHPSWAASQQKKLAMQQAKPCGKKITFDDDDD